MLKTIGISHVVLNVRDLDTMVDFYVKTLGLTISHQNPGRMVFMSADTEKDDHMIALAKGLEGENNNLLAHIAWKVASVVDVKGYYQYFKENGIPIDHNVSHAYAFGGNTVSCYFLDPEGNHLEVYALVPGQGEGNAAGNYGIDLEQSVEDITAQAMRLTPAAAGARH